MLLAPSGWASKRVWILSSFDAESGYCPCALPERALPGRQQDVGHQLCVSVGGEEGVDKRGAHLSVETNV